MSGAPTPSPGDDIPARTEAPMGAAQQVDTSLSLPQLIRIVVINVLVLAELCIAMYAATQNPDEFNPVFFKVLFSLLVPTLILGFVSKRFIRQKERK